MGAVSNFAATLDPTTTDGLTNLATGVATGGASLVPSLFNSDLTASNAIDGTGRMIDQKLLGGEQADAAKKAADQADVKAQTALELQERTTNQIRGDLQPFRDAGSGAISSLQGAINDPSSRVLNNPFFQTMAADQEQRLLASQAARGKVGSGETGDDLQRNLLLLGNQFAQQDITNLQNLTNTGSNAAAQTGSFLQQGASSQGGILGNMANNRSAQIIGGANARAQGVNNILQLGATGAGAALSDVRLKENVKFSHMQDDIRMYNWDWTEEGKALAGDQITTGPIAQELKINHPELVVMDEEIGFYRVLM
jgi:hypothetical protein